MSDTKARKPPIQQFKSVWPDIWALIHPRRGLLAFAYYDSNKTGTLVSRIMTDVEGVRNLIGTGLVEFVGGLITASIALVVLILISPLMTLVACICLGGFALILKRAFVTIRPIY